MDSDAFPSPFTRSNGPGSSIWLTISGRSSRITTRNSKPKRTSCFFQAAVQALRSAPAVLSVITPATLFHTQLTTIAEKLPAVLDGRVEGIHDARIATRRVRELLPLLPRAPRWGSVDDVDEYFATLGRSLGRVRDADVRVALLASLEQRIPYAAPTLVLVRQRREHERLALMRRLIKRLERLDAVRMLAALASERLHRTRFRDWRGGSPSWQRKLRSLVCGRAEAAREAIAHATGVYFPNRAHSARIAIKRLRYATEIVHATGVADRTETIRQLKKAQDLLGDLHDRQELSDHLGEDVSRTAGESAADDQVALARQVIDAEVREIHQRCLARRERLIAACTEAADLPWMLDLRIASMIAAGAL